MRTKVLILTALVGATSGVACKPRRDLSSLRENQIADTTVGGKFKPFLIYEEEGEILLGVCPETDDLGAQFELADCPANKDPNPENLNAYPPISKKDYVRLLQSELGTKDDATIKQMEADAKTKDNAVAPLQKLFDDVKKGTSDATILAPIENKLNQAKAEAATAAQAYDQVTNRAKEATQIIQALVVGKRKMIIKVKQSTGNKDTDAVPTRQYDSAYKPFLDARKKNVEFRKYLDSLNFHFAPKPTNFGSAIRACDSAMPASPRLIKLFAKYKYPRKDATGQPAPTVQQDQSQQSQAQQQADQQTQQAAEVINEIWVMGVAAFTEGFYENENSYDAPEFADWVEDLKDRTFWQGQTMMIDHNDWQPNYAETYSLKTGQRQRRDLFTDKAAVLCVSPKAYLIPSGQPISMGPRILVEAAKSRSVGNEQVTSSAYKDVASSPASLWLCRAKGLINAKRVGQAKDIPITFVGITGGSQVNPIGETLEACNGALVTFNSDTGGSCTMAKGEANTPSQDQGQGQQAQGQNQQGQEGQSGNRSTVACRNLVTGQWAPAIK